MVNFMVHLNNSVVIHGCKVEITLPCVCAIVELVSVMGRPTKAEEFAEAMYNKCTSKSLNMKQVVKAFLRYKPVKKLLKGMYLEV